MVRDGLLEAARKYDLLADQADQIIAHRFGMLFHPACAKR